MELASGHSVVSYEFKAEVCGEGKCKAEMINVAQPQCCELPDGYDIV